MKEEDEYLAVAYFEELKERTFGNIMLMVHKQEDSGEFVVEEQASP